MKNLEPRFTKLAEMILPKDLTMIRIMLISLTTLAVASCVNSNSETTLKGDEQNSGDIWISAANKAASGGENQYDLLISAPDDKDQLIICEADQPELCNKVSSKQYHRVMEIEVNHPRSLFEIKNFTLSENMVIAIKAWKTNDNVAFGRVVELKAENGAVTPATSTENGDI